MLVRSKTGMLAIVQVGDVVRFLRSFVKRNLEFVAGEIQAFGQAV